MSLDPAKARARALELMGRVLRDGAPLADEYPLVFGPAASGEVLWAEEEGRVVAACATLVRDLAAGRERLRAGLIGSVCTDPEHRARGHATRLLERAAERLADQGCALGFLWADDPAYYEKRGWRSAGNEWLYTIDAPAAAGLAQRLGRARWSEELAATIQPGGAASADGPAGVPQAADATRGTVSAPPPTLRALAPDDHGALHRLYLLHRSRTDRTVDEMRALLAVPGASTLVLERGRDIAAYACLGRGADLAHCVHEWSGAPDDVLALVLEHVARRARAGERDPVHLMAPPRGTSANPLHARLSELGLAPHRGVLAMAKVLDADAAAELARRASRGTLRTASLLERAGAHLTRHTLLAGPGGEHPLAGSALLDLLLPARSDRDSIEALERQAGVELPGLPLSIYLWGLDSI